MDKLNPETSQDRLTEDEYRQLLFKHPLELGCTPAVAVGTVRLKELLAIERVVDVDLKELGEWKQHAATGVAIREKELNDRLAILHCLGQALGALEVCILESRDPSKLVKLVAFIHARLFDAGVSLE